MAFVALAIGGSAALGTGASIFGGITGGNAAKEGAAAQQDAISRAITTQQGGQRDALAYLDPFRQFGLNAGSSLQDATFSPEQRMGQLDSQRQQLQAEVERLKASAPQWESYQVLTGPRASERRASMFTQENQLAKQKLREAQARLKSFDQQYEQEKQRINQPQPGIQESAFYKFQAELLNRSQDRAMAARGLTGSGFEAEERRRGLIELGAGETERQFSRMKGLYDVGAQTSQVGAGILTGTANNIANLQVGAGNAQAQGIAGVANSQIGMVNGITNQVNSAVGMGLNYAQFDKLINANAGGGRPAPSSTQQRYGDGDWLPGY